MTTTDRGQLAADAMFVQGRSLWSGSQVMPNDWPEIISITFTT